MKMTNKKIVIQVLGIHLLLAFLSFIIFLITDSGRLIMLADFNNQQIPFNILANESVKSGNISWNPYIDLGTNFIAAFSFYNIGSPFFWISCIFPAMWFPYLVGILYILKYVAAGLFSFLYLRRFCGKDIYAVIGSVLYAFSGFQSVNLLFYHFHDVVAFFPLMLIGLEKLMTEHKKGFFAAAVGLNAFLNYFFFVGEVLFIILYFCVRFLFVSESVLEEKISIKGSIQIKLKKIGWALSEGIIGVMAAGVLFIPSAYYVLGIPKASIHMQLSDAFILEKRKFLQIIQAFIFPGSIMSKQTAFYPTEYSSCAAYLPMAGLIFVILYIMYTKKDWLKRMLILCFVIAFVPILNNAFTMFNSYIYERWFYMFILLMSLATIKVLEHREQYGKKKIWFGYIAFLLLFVAVVEIRQGRGGEAVIYRPVLFLIFAAAALAGTVICAVLYFMVKNIKKYERYFLCAVSLCAVASTAGTLYLYKDVENNSSEDYYQRYEALEQVKDYGDMYRFRTSDNTITMLHNISGTGSFSSTVSGSIFTFYERLGLYRSVNCPEGPEGTEELLSGRYIILTEPMEAEDVVLVQEIQQENYHYYIYEKTDVLPIGFTYDQYMTVGEFVQLDPSVRAAAMLKVLVIPDEYEDRVSDILDDYQEAEDGIITTEAIDDYLKERGNECIDEAAYGSNSYEASITTSRETYGFFSIPNDSGWKAYVNGQETEIIDINGFMAVKLEAGHNDVKFEYHTPMIKAGWVSTAAGIIIFIAYIYIGRKKERNGVSKA